MEWAETTRENVSQGERLHLCGVSPLGPQCNFQSRSGSTVQAPTQDEYPRPALAECPQTRSPPAPHHKKVQIYGDIYGSGYTPLRQIAVSGDTRIKTDSP